MRYVFLIPPALEGRNPDLNFGCNYGIVSLPPIHILYPAAVLENEGHKVEFIDCPIEGKNVNWCKNFINNQRVDYYVLFGVFLSKDRDIYWSKYIKKHSNNSKIIFMGPEPSHKPEDYIKYSDMVIIGEPEKAIKKYKPGIVHSPLIKNLDELPFPARHLIENPYKYFSSKLNKLPMTVVLTSRNCYGRCIYCIPCAHTFAREIGYKKKNNFNKPPVGLRTPEDIYEEFKLLKEKGYKSVAIIDDNFVNGIERTNKICELIKPLKMEWGCLARADALQDEEMLRNMKEAGCKYIDIGVESFNQKILDYIKKDTTPGEIFNAILLMKKVGIKPKINILLGCCPFQTKEDLDYTIEVLKRLDVGLVSFSIVTPHPMTEYYKIVKKNEWFVNTDWKGVDPYREAEISLPGMSNDELKEMIDYCYRKYYINLPFIFKRLSKIRSFRELKDNIKMFWRLFI